MRYVSLPLFVLAACGADGSTSPEPTPDFDPDYDPGIIAMRPYGLKVPDGYAGNPTPFVLALHGLGWNGVDHAQATGLMSLADTRGFLLAYPDGTPTQAGRGWNASCCDSLNLGFDDVHYLRAVIADVRLRYKVDPAQIFVQGISNGAFMAHVLACEAADVVAAITPLAGTMWAQEIAECQPSAPVAIMHTHGTADGTVHYAGGSFYGVADYVGAEAAIDVWRDRNDCAADSSSATANVDDDVAGDETHVERWSGCAAPVELWTVQDGEHIPALSNDYLTQMVDFLYDNARR